MTSAEHFCKVGARFATRCRKNIAELKKICHAAMASLSQKSNAIVKGASHRASRGKEACRVKLAAMGKSAKAVFQKIRLHGGKFISLCRKNTAVAVVAVLGLAGLFGLSRLAVYNPDRGEPSVVFNEQSRRIIVYHQKKKVYVETDNSRFVMMDYGREMAAEGVLFQAPAWFVSGDRSVYSTQTWRQFNQMADQPELATKQKEYEKYIALAHAKIAAKGIQKQLVF